MVYAKAQVCFKCHKVYSPKKIVFECEECGGSIIIKYKHDDIKKRILKEEFVRDPPSHWKYWMFYPILDLSSVVSMFEGGTPLIPSRRIKNLLFKFEGTNPTGSFKDRGSTVEITKAKELRVHSTACASTGNMGASIAAYCARAGIDATIFVPQGAPAPKLAQMRVHGAEIVRVRGTYADAMDGVRKLMKKGVYLTGDYAYRQEGEKSVGFEIIDQLGWQIPDYIVCPVGMGTLLSAVYKGLVELKETKLIKKIPKLVGVQAQGCKPVVEAFRKKSKTIKPEKYPMTIARAIACGAPNYGLEALDALKRSKGLAEAVSDKEISAARKELGKEGIYAEPAGAVSYAGAKKLKLKGQVVCIVSGHGLKDPKEYG